MDRPHRKLAPPVLRDGVDFLPGVLSDPRFGSNGILFGTEGNRVNRLHWAVIDPDRHVMYAWRKASSSIVASGRGLGASVFTNGPFTNYPYGRLLHSVGRYGTDAARAMVRTRGGPGGVGTRLGPVGRRHLQARFPLGWVVGAHEGIRETVVSRPRIFWFGRGPGLTFTDYGVGRGDPTDAAEAVGGLFRGVTGYQTTNVQRVMRTGYWALAPLTEGPNAGRDATRRALDLYRARQDEERLCTGVVMVVAGRAHTRRLNELLVAVGVRDALQFDGGDSLLLGRGRTVLVGRAMPPWKRVLQCWGVQFQPRTRAE